MTKDTQEGLRINRRQQQILFGIEKMDTQDQELFFLSRPFASLSLPHRREWDTTVSKKNGDKVEVLVHNVTNGRDTLIIEGSPSFGMPYGSYPRLFHYFICSEIKRTKKAEICLNSSMTEFMKELGLSGKGDQRKRFLDQIIRFLNASYRLEKTNPETGKTTVILPDKPVQMYDIDTVWKGKKSSSTPEVARIVFKDWFVQEILDSSIPFHKEAIISLKGSTLAMDLYTWITWRSHTLNMSKKKIAIIKYESFEAQLGVNYKDHRFFKRDLKKAFLEVSALYPSANMEIGQNKVVLHAAPEAIKASTKK